MACQIHDVCKEIDNLGGRQKGAALLLLGIKDNNYYALLGYEKWCKSYTLCAGKRDRKDECYISVVERELEEEFKIVLNKYGGCIKENKKFQDNGKIRYIINNGCPIFVGIYDMEQIDIDELNNKIDKDNANDKLDSCFKEMGRLDWFNIMTLNYVMVSGKKNKKVKEYIGKSYDEQECKLSYFAYICITKYIRNHKRKKSMFN